MSVAQSIPSTLEWSPLCATHSPTRPHAKAFIERVHGGTQTLLSLRHPALSVGWV